MGAAALARAIGAGLLDFALPPRCPACGEIVDGPHRFCAGCWGELEFLGDAGCAGCGLPLPVGGDRCATCLAHPPVHDGALAAVAYGPAASRIALRLKYGRRPGLAETVARQMARLVPAGEWLLVPVPLHRGRLWRRGYNQAALIARALGRRTGRPVAVDALARTRATPVLRGLGPAARARAVRDAFAVRPGAVPPGARILLVDDVLTTGATADACAAALTRAGAARVRPIVWARVVPHDDD